MARTIQEFKSAHSPDQEVAHLRAKVAELERKLRAERDATGEARLIALALTEAIEATPPPKMVYSTPKKTSTAPIDFVVQLTDLHNGEVTKPGETERFGEFNPDIFNRRLDQLAADIIRYVGVQRSGYHIPRLRILGTGDYVSGDIHEELKVTNAYPAPVQAVNCGYQLGKFVATVAPHFESVVADLLTLDNHGRMTRKNQAAEGGENNWGYVVAHIVKQFTSAISNVEVRIHPHATALVTVGRERYLTMHGHQIKGWAGLPYYGFDRRVALEAVKRMGHQESEFTKMVLGHFHVGADTLYWLIGGSLSGTNAFDHGCGRHAPAHQTSWLVHPKHGQFSFTRWWLQ